MQRDSKSKRMMWFRFYSEALDDPKVQRLPPHLFKAWVNMLCLASSNNGKLPSVDDIAFRLRLSVQDAEQQVTELVLAGLLDVTLHGTEPHNWNRRQFVSDSSTERVRKHRRNNAETQCNVSETAIETAPEQIQSRADTETDSDSVDVAPVPKPQRTTDSKRGSRLPADWTLPSDLRAWAQINFSSDDAAIDLEADRFRDFWIAKPGSAGCKLDWHATWRNWCRNVRQPATMVARHPASQPSQAMAALDRLRAKYAAEGAAS